MNHPVSKSTTHPRPHWHRPFHHQCLRALAPSGGLIGLTLVLGILGYHFIAGFKWVYLLLNAAMILTGMGPVGALNSDASKYFASAYALLSGLIFVTATGIMLVPIFHRVLQRFHIEEREIR